MYRFSFITTKMEFRSQRELLEYLGKNTNDRNLIKRLIKRWEVEYEGGVYYLVDKDKRIEELEKENENLKKNIWEDTDGPTEDERELYIQQINELKEELWEVYRKNSELEQRLGYAEWEIEKNPAKNNSDDLLLHLEYLYNRIIACNIFRDEVVQQFYNKNQKEYDFDWAKEKCYQQFKYVEDLEEAQELEFILWILEWQEH